MAGGIPSGSNPSGWTAGTPGSNPAQGFDPTAAAGAVVGTGAPISGQLAGIAAGISNMISRTQATITTAYQAQVQNDPTMTALSDTVFAGLNPDGSTPVTTLLLQALLNAFGGSSSSASNAALLAAIEASWSELQQAWIQLQAFLETGNWSDLVVAFSDIYKAFFGSNASTGVTSSLAAPAVTNTSHTPQPVANFPNAASLVGVSYNGGGWAWDNTVSYIDPSTGVPSSGSAKCTANGMVQAQNGVVTQVQPGQTVSLAPAVMWSYLAAASGTSPIQVQIVPWSGTSTPGTAATPILLAEVTSPIVSEGAWTPLTVVTNSATGVASGVYTVPSSGVGFVQARIVVTADATAGSVWWNACDTIISGGYIATIDAGVAQLQSDAVASTAATQAFLNAINTANTADAGNIPQWLTDVGAAYTVWAATESGIAQNELATIGDILQAALGFNPITALFPPTQVAGVDGLQTMETTFTTMWNQGIEALQADLSSVGLSGFAQSLSGLAVQANNIQASALSTAAVQAIVNNNPVQAGLEATVVSNGDYHQAVALSSAPITKTASLGTIVTAGQAKTFGFLQWMGEYTSALAGVSGGPAFVANFYRMDASGNLVHLFTTSDIGPSVPGTMAWILDVMAALPCAATDLIGIEFQVVASGSVIPWGFTAPPAGNHPTALNKMLGFSQNWNGATATTISAANIGWTGNAPYVGIGVGTPPPTPFFPQSSPYYVSSTHVPPSWAQYVDLVGVGSGGGGEGETGAGNGDGGTGGIWGGVTLTVGVTNTVHAGMDIPVGGVITITVGAGGSGGAFFTPGSNGGNTLFSWVDMAGATKTITCSGGAGGQPSTNLTSWGLSPGNFTYTTTAPSAQSTPYIGGSVNAIGGVGNSPGGGGSGGAAFQFGFAGATGQAWTVDRQT